MTRRGRAGTAAPCLANHRPMFGDPAGPWIARPLHCGCLAVPSTPGSSGLPVSGSGTSSSTSISTAVADWWWQYRAASWRWGGDGPPLTYRAAFAAALRASGVRAAPAGASDAEAAREGIQPGSGWWRAAFETGDVANGGGLTNERLPESVIRPK